MKMLFKNTLSILLALTLILGSVYTGIGEVNFSGMFAIKTNAAQSGKCGKNLNWTIDETGTLTISGNGNMYNYSTENSEYYTPWYWLDVKSVIIKKGITSIGNYAFAGCRNLKSVKIANTVTNIGSSAFMWCESLTSVTIPNSVTKIGAEAFYMCSSLTTVKIGSNVTSIGAEAFLECENLESIIIPDSVTRLGTSAFKSCVSLKKVKIGNGLKNIQPNTFDYCTNISELILGNSLKKIGDYAFYFCENLTSVTIPDSVTNIGKNAFAHCTNIKTVKIGNSVTTIGDDAFCGCYKLKSITIPKTVKSIGVFAFYNCYSLTDVYYTGSKSAWNKINIGLQNEYLIYANIHYNTPIMKDIKNVANGVKVTWNAVNGAKSYHIYRKAESGNWILIAKGIKKTSYIDKNVKSGTVYKYKVRAYNKTGLSQSISTYIQIKHIASPEITKIANTTTGIQVKWSKVTGAKGYYIYRKTGSGNWTKIATITSQTKCSYRDKSTKKGVTYTYTIKAYSGSYISGYESGVKCTDKH